jgi:hypothetical protein
MPEHYTCSDYPLDQNPSPAGTTIRPRDESQDREALRNIRTALRHFSKEGFLSQAGCRKFLGSLLSQTNSTQTLEGFAQNISMIANYIADQTFIYDGPNSETTLTRASFLDAGDKGALTVKQWFASQNNAHGLSQYDGAAIFLNFNHWEGNFGLFSRGSGATRNGMGTLLHEILHKREAGSFKHEHFYRAAQAAGSTGRALGTNENSYQMGLLCFGEND